MNKSFEIQNQIRQSATALNESFADLKQWEKDMKAKEKLRQENVTPIAGESQEESEVSSQSSTT
jgi:hypothetical protein